MITAQTDLVSAFGLVCVQGILYGIYQFHGICVKVIIGPIVASF
jgi:hypothetical protein